MTSATTPSTLPAKRAVVVSFNWLTEEILYTSWEGDGCAAKADAWANSGSFVWRDFPASKGWTHIRHWTREAGEEFGSQMVKELLGPDWKGHS